MNMLVQNRRHVLPLTLFFFICLTDSMDTFLNLNVAGFSLRIVLVFFVLACGLFLYQILVKEKGRIQASIAGGFFLLIWICVLALFIPFSTLLARNLFYFLWLLLSVAYVLTVSEWVRTESLFQTVLRLFLISFVVLAGFGILQFLLGIFEIDVLVAQHWMSRFIRVNAFSYEPSFYATYLMTGWGILLILFITKDKHEFKFPVSISLSIVTVGLLLSSSRAAWLLMVLTVAVVFIVEVIRTIVRRAFSRTGLFFIVFVLIAVVALAIVFVLFTNKLDFLLFGLGVGSEASQSLDIRVSIQQDMLDAFIKNPFIGTGIGGVPFSVAGVQGIQITTQAEAKPFEGINIFLEILLSSGLFGFFAFIAFVIVFGFRLLEAFIRWRKREPEAAYIRLSILVGVVLTFVFLATNQNILRPYVWVLLAVANAGISTLPGFQKGTTR